MSLHQEHSGEYNKQSEPELEVWYECKLPDVLYVSSTPYRADVINLYLKDRSLRLYKKRTNVIFIILLNQDAAR